ncbi:MAG: hypothetical protein RLZZ350_1004, partial [Verrucomicrobiota bacterium]
KTHRAGEIACDELLFDKLRILRKQLADERSVPSYIIFSDVALRQMARLYPASDVEFARISGVGEKKLREFGAVFMEQIAAHLQTNARQIFAEEVLAALKLRQKITLTKPIAPTETQTHRAGEIACDELLFDKLRILRKQLADERSVPSYIIFSDVALRQMARLYPASDAEFARISGVGEKKLREFGAVFMEQIAAHLQTNARQIFAEEILPARVPSRSSLNDTMRETLHFYRSGKTVQEIADVRGLKMSTIYGHLEEAMHAGETVDVNALVSPDAQCEIAAEFAKRGFGNLGGVVEALGGKYDYGQCKLVRAKLQGR